MLVTKKIKSMSTSKGVTEEEIKILAMSHLKGFYAKAPYQPQEEADFIQDVAEINWIRGYKAALEAYASTKEVVREEDGWIDVNEKLPEASSIVLVYIVGYGAEPEIVKARLNWSHGYWVHIGGYGTIDEYITHWRPLPSPPKTNQS